jgi:hypothetical protein
MKKQNPPYFREKTDKSNINNHLSALGRFNEWEANCADKIPGNQSLAGVFELYELIPEVARQRPVDPQGVIEMHKALACLK